MHWPLVFPINRSLGSTSILQSPNTYILLPSIFGSLVHHFFPNISILSSNSCQRDKSRPVEDEYSMPP
ncbi:hypothetical protein K1719_001425 [Acacia pycnantha]|nr:hypothetical protein K1719_001425 [Acacia pycnantha]